MFLIPLFLYPAYENPYNLILAVILLSFLDVVIWIYEKKFSLHAHKKEKIDTCKKIAEKQNIIMFIFSFFVGVVLLFPIISKFIFFIYRFKYINIIFSPFRLIVPSGVHNVSIQYGDYSEQNVVISIIFAIYTAYVFEHKLFYKVTESYYRKYKIKHRNIDEEEKLSKADNNIIISYIIICFISSLMYMAICRSIIVNKGFHVSNPVVIITFVGSLWLLGLCSGALVRLISRKIIG